jgi:hypothetical protein
MPSDVMTTVVVTQAVAVNLRELSRRMGRDLDGMFTAKLSTSGSLPATHYISSGYIRPAYLNVMTDATRLFNVAKKAWNDDGDTFPFTQAQVTNALSNCTVSDGTREVDGVVVTESAHELIARLGLKLVNEGN